MEVGFIDASEVEEELLVVRIGKERTLQERMGRIVRVSECNKGPVLLLFGCGGIVFGIVDYVFGRRIHNLFVVLVQGESSRGNVFCILEEVINCSSESSMVGNPCRDGGQGHLYSGFGLDIG